MIDQDQKYQVPKPLFFSKAWAQRRCFCAMCPWTSGRRGTWGYSSERFRCGREVEWRVSHSYRGWIYNQRDIYIRIISHSYCGCIYDQLDIYSTYIYNATGSLSAVPLFIRKDGTPTIKFRAGLVWKQVAPAETELPCGRIWNCENLRYLRQTCQQSFPGEKWSFHSIQLLTCIYIYVYVYR